MWKTNLPASSRAHMINYCWVVGNSKGAMSNYSRLSSSFMNTRPHEVLHSDRCFSTMVQSG